METKTCTRCMSEMDRRALKCPNCRARAADAPPLHRGHDNKMVAGVCAALAPELGVDVTLVRVGFIVLTVLTGGVMFWIYTLLWLALPADPNGVAPLSRLLNWLSGLLGSTPRSPEPPRSV
jgi:phage shock protein PspC (stress-responsive transcriptional regulator)